MEVVVSWRFTVVPLHGVERTTICCIVLENDYLMEDIFNTVVGSLHLWIEANRLISPLSLSNNTQQKARDAKLLYLVWILNSIVRGLGKMWGVEWSLLVLLRHEWTCIDFVHGLCWATLSASCATKLQGPSTRMSRPQEWAIHKNEPSTRMSRPQEWAIHKNEPSTRMSRPQEWAVHKNEPSTRMSHPQEWAVHKNEPSTRMSHPQEWAGNWLHFAGEHGCVGLSAPSHLLGSPPPPTHTPYDLWQTGYFSFAPFGNFKNNCFLLPDPFKPSSVA